MSAIFFEVVFSCEVACVFPVKWLILHKSNHEEHNVTLTFYIKGPNIASIKAKICTHKINHKEEMPP